MANQKLKSFWKHIRFKYKLLFLNESTLEEVWSFRLSLFTIFLYLCVFAVILVALTSVIIILTPIRNYLPGYLDVEVRKEILRNALRADSLEQQINVQSRYLENISAIMTGNVVVDSIKATDSMSYSASNYDIPQSEREALYAKKFEEEEKYNLTALNPSPTNTEIFFYKPVNGTISSGFDPDKQHYGTDLVAAPKESILATLEGTVIFAGFDPNYGNTIALQHTNNYVSIYKHNDLLLKKIGEKVIAGEAIAIIGNTGKLSTGPHLHFELWHNGEPVNPEEYIVF